MLSGARGDGLVKDNAVRILAEVEALHWRSGKRVVLVGHSKGGVDSAACLSMFEHRLRDVVRGVVLVQSPYGGSAIATDLLAEPSLAKTVQSLLTKLVGLPSSTPPPSLISMSRAASLEDLEAAVGRARTRAQAAALRPKVHRALCSSIT